MRRKTLNDDRNDSGITFATAIGNILRNKEH
jgi:hypothetical protein